jgi:hypothetical protein
LAKKEISAAAPKGWCNSEPRGKTRSGKEVFTILRQKLLILYSHTPDLKSQVGAWTIYDAAGEEHHTTGDSDTPPYRSVFAAMQDGWRVIQFPQQFPPYPAWN